MSEGAMTQDWGDFGSVINELEQEEAAGVLDSSELAANDSESESDSNKSEAMAGMLSVAFVLTEQATSAISDVDFEFNEKGKQAVIDAAIPVFEKHGDALMDMFGDYIEEVTLLIAVISLTYTAKRHVQALKMERAKELADEQEAVQSSESN